MEAAGWQQHHRIPAFGDWNYYDYPRDDDDGAGVHDHWPPVTPCFDFASAMRTTTAARPAAQQKSCDKVKVAVPHNDTKTYSTVHNGFQKIFYKYFSSCW